MIGRRRREEDDRPAVEFVEGTAPAKPPTVPRDSRRTAWSRRWYLLLSGAVLIGVALLAKRQHAHDPVAPSTAATSPTAAAPSATFDAAHCPSPSPCAVSHEIPAGAAAAIEQQFPTARVGDATTVTFPSGELWYREVSAHVGALNVVVSVARPEGHPVTLEPARPDTIETYFRQDVDGLVIQVAADGALRDVPDVARLHRLAADPRVFAVN